MPSDATRDTWERGDPYERYMGRWSRRVASRFLSWLDLPAGHRWLDIGSGTGAVIGSILDQCAPASVTGVEPSDGFIETAVSFQSSATRVRLLRGTAGRLPLETGSVDAVVSGLVLNFVPDPRGALAEMTRVSVPGGTIAAYVWDYAGGMEMLRAFWDAAVELDPAAGSLDEGNRFPLCRPEALSELHAGAGLHHVDVRPIDVPTPFTTFDDYWQPFLGGQGPAPAYAMALEGPARVALRDLVRQRLPIDPDGSIRLTARAWAVRGMAPA